MNSFKKMIIGNVGQDKIESIYFINMTRDCSWRMFEGTKIFDIKAVEKFKSCLDPIWTHFSNYSLLFSELN